MLTKQFSNQPPKMKRCASCRGEFQPSRPMQKVCCLECAQELARKKREKIERAETRAAKERIKPRSQWMKEAQAAVNAYVRARDAHLGCVSCDKPASWGGQWHASHYRSVGAASAVRFNVFNIHKACSVCNHHLSGNVAAYKPRLIEKIGADKVEWLDAQNQTVRYDIEYLKRLKRIFSKRANRLEKKIGKGSV